MDRLGDDSVRQDLKQGVGGSPLLTDAELAAFDEFYKLVGPDREQNMRSVHGLISEWMHYTTGHLSHAPPYTFMQID